VNKSELLDGLLKRVSRSFFLTLRVLPGNIREPIGIAYLLARASDTIADTQLVAVDKRVDLLKGFLARVAGESHEKLDVGIIAGSQESAAEGILLQEIESAIGLLDEISPWDRDRIRDVIKVIVGGQSLDVERFAGGSDSDINSLSTVEELDDYTFRVAGVVGDFWTRICCRHRLEKLVVAPVDLLDDGIRFGKGLQLVNILRDLPGDLKDGRCYFPSEALRRVGLTPSDLLLPQNFDRFRPLYAVELDRAREHLEAGWRYTLRIPKSEMRLSLACAWPILIGIRTLALLQHANPLDASQRIKVSRSEIRTILFRSLLAYPVRTAWRNQWSRLAF